MLKINRSGAAFAVLALLVWSASVAAGPKHSQAIAAPKDSTRVVVLGDSRGNGKKTQSTNADELEALLGLIKAERPEAVFFTGDMALGLVQKGAGDSTPPEGGEDTNWGAKGFVYDSSTYKNQLSDFAAILHSALPAGIPFYPVAGNHEAMGPDSIDAVRAQFELRDANPPDSAHLNYSRDVAKAHFAVLATDAYDAAAQGPGEHDLSEASLAWLDGDLKAHASSRFRFVLAHEPAFTVAADKPKGLDVHPEIRDKLWGLLKADGVSAYICAHEHMYDASQHDGVWQIITGGAGAKLSKTAPDPFFHYVVLSLPLDSEAAGHVKVVDDRGQVRAEYDL